MNRYLACSDSGKVDIIDAPDMDDAEAIWEKRLAPDEQGYVVFLDGRVRRPVGQGVTCKVCYEYNLSNYHCSAEKMEFERHVMQKHPTQVPELIEQGGL
jgi:hypothetical protein